MYDFEWKNENVLAKVILKPNKAKEIVRDLDKTSPTVRITVTDGHISFLTDGELGKIKVPEISTSDFTYSCFYRA